MMGSDWRKGIRDTKLHRGLSDFHLKNIVFYVLQELLMHFVTEFSGLKVLLTKNNPLSQLLYHLWRLLYSDPVKEAARSVKKYKKAEGKNDLAWIMKQTQLFEFVFWQVRIRLTKQSVQFDSQAPIIYSVDVIFLEAQMEISDNWTRTKNRTEWPRVVAQPLQLLFSELNVHVNVCTVEKVNI